MNEKDIEKRIQLSATITKKEFSADLRAAISQLYHPLESKERRISPKAYSVSGIEQDGRRGVRENIENGEAELNGLGIYKLKKEVLNTSFYFIKRRFFKA